MKWLFQLFLRVSVGLALGFALAYEFVYRVIDMVFLPY